MEPHGRNLPVPHPRSYWVEPGTFIAGSYPGDLGKREAEAKLAALLDAGVRSFMNLMEPDEVDSSGNLFRPYEALCRQLAQSRGIEVAFHRMPIHDESVPTPDHMARILDVIDAEMRRGVVYVHCWGGRGRTGTVVGCWLARHGRAVGDEALRRVQHLRRHEETASKLSPQTECQREMVRRWREGI
ncbi:MAG: protein-tyrosine phosphatase family protein [Armatimonadota bacterium]|jgi:hypothetical protein